MKTYSSKISANYNEQGLHINVSMSCSPIRSHTGRCSCLTQTWFKQTAQEGSKLLHQGTVAEKVTTPSLCCTILTLESTVERMQTYKLMLYYVCRPEWGAVHQDIALTEQKPDLVVTYDWWKIWSWLALMHTTSLSRLDVGEWEIPQTMKKTDDMISHLQLYL